MQQQHREHEEALPGDRDQPVRVQAEETDRLGLEALPAGRRRPRGRCRRRRIGGRGGGGHGRALARAVHGATVGAAPRPPPRRCDRPHRRGARVQRRRTDADGAGRPRRAEPRLAGRQADRCDEAGGAVIGSVVSSSGWVSGPCASARLERLRREGERAGAPLRHQRVPLRPRRGEVALLDVAVAADLLRDAGDLDGQRRGWPASGARSSSSIDGAVLADQRALGAALLGAAEDVERRAAQALEPAPARLNAGQHPRPELLLLPARPCRSSWPAAAARGGSSSL